MANDTDALEAALARFDRPVRVDGLVAALGLEPRFTPLAGEPAHEILRGAQSQPTESWRAGERAGMAALLLVFERGVPAVAAADSGRRLAALDPTRQYLLILCPSSIETITLAAAGLDGEVRHLTFERTAPRMTDLETLAEMVARVGDGGVALAARYARALDRTRVSSRFFRDFRAQRERVAHTWLGLPRAATPERMALALLFLGRLLFLYLLQRLGHLAEDPEYLVNRWRTWQRRVTASDATFFRSVLQPLFFGALNTRPGQRTPEARALGPLPYLNGGLFERTALERTVPGLDLPDPVAGHVFDDLFERYRFTPADVAEGVALGVPGSGIDPAMLGRVFEGLMAPDQRGRTGTFYTPPHVVDGLVAAALDACLGARRECSPRDAAGLSGSAGGASLDAVRRLRVLDPACGSGAFLLGALARLASLRRALGDDAQRARIEIVAESLHGVDLQADAALLCSLRLWLALTLPTSGGKQAVAPLPNLDRRIRQGDALLDPLDLAFPEALALPFPARIALQREIAEIAPVARRYLASETGDREALQSELLERELRIARTWIDGWSASAERERRTLEARSAQRDLWGEPTGDARAAGEALETLEGRTREIDRFAAGLRESGSLPFFSFPVHFPETALRGFDVILMNPPWVRSHRFPIALRGIVRRRYAVCRQPGWSSPALAGGRRSGGQVDLAMLFLERATGLLAPGGALGAVLPAKMLRSLYAGPARRLLSQSMRISRIEDFSLDQRALFEADSFAATVVAVKSSAGAPDSQPSARVRVSMHRPGRETLSFDSAQEDLPLVPGDPASPWLLAPAEARAAIRRMQAAGPPLGHIARRGIQRGIETGANDVLVVRELEPRIGRLASIRAEGAFRPDRNGEPLKERRPAADFEAVIEDSALRPLVRGADIAAWRFDVRRHVIRCRDDDGRPLPACPRLAKYLERHGPRARNGARPSDRKYGNPAGGRYRVAWHDLASTLQAVALPATFRTVFPEGRALLPLNTVYSLDAEDEPQALCLAAYLNSLPARTFAAAIAERAKDAHFRFFSWTLSLVPVPEAVRRGALATRIARLSGRAHAEGEIREADQEELDGIVASALGLNRREREALTAFDAWLRGRPHS